MLKGGVNSTCVSLEGGLCCDNSVLIGSKFKVIKISRLMSITQLGCGTVILRCMPGDCAAPTVSVSLWCNPNHDSYLSQPHTPIVKSEQYMVQQPGLHPGTYTRTIHVDNKSLTTKPNYSADPLTSHPQTEYSICYTFPIHTLCIISTYRVRKYRL